MVGDKNAVIAERLVKSKAVAHGGSGASADGRRMQMGFVFIHGFTTFAKDEISIAHFGASVKPKREEKSRGYKKPPHPNRSAAVNKTQILRFLSLNDAFYVFLGLLGDHAVESEQCHNIRERHKAVDDISKRPHKIDLKIRTGKDSQNVKHTVH